MDMPSKETDSKGNESGGQQGVRKGWGPNPQPAFHLQNPVVSKEMPSSLPQEFNSEPLV